MRRGERQTRAGAYSSLTIWLSVSLAYDWQMLGAAGSTC
jgi:hypothetical protein